jgi:Tfp pilus assembly protein PilF
MYSNIPVGIAVLDARVRGGVMDMKRVCRSACLVAGLIAFLSVAAADYFTLIIEGNVVMPDGSPPPKTVGIERVCSDVQASGPGPLADKKGHYTWKMDLDPENTRVCFLRATMPGFTSTRVELDKINLADFQQNKVLKVETLTLQPRDTGESNRTVLTPEDEAPGKVRTQYKAAIKALDSNNMDEAIKQLQLAVKGVPKFADGWNILGALYEQKQMLMEARDALLHAIEANPKLASPYLRLSRISNKLGDWDAAAKNEDALLKIETRFYPEIYLQQGITRFELKNLAGAEESLKTAQSLDPAHRLTRAEYVLGMIALAKGDVKGAKEHIASYMKSDPTTPDIERIQVQLDTLGTPDAPKLDIALERP